MKKIYLIGILLIALLAINVSATKNISVSSISTISEKPSRDFQRTFTITNTGNESLNLDITVNGLSNFGIKVDPQTGISVPVAEQKTITVNGTVYEDVETERTGDKAGDTFSGSLSIKSGSVELGSVALNVLAAGQLNFNKFKVNGDSTDDGDKVDGIQPGDTVEFSGELENLFDEDIDDLDIEGVELTITIEGIDDDDDLEESEDIGDIKSEDKESFSIEFLVPDDVEAGDYDVIIEAEGDDENGGKHTVHWEIVIEVEKDSHDIWVTKATVSPTKVSCSRNVNLNVQLKNQGEKDEDEVVVRIESSDLAIDEEDTSIPELEEGTGDDTEYEKTYSFRIDSKVKAGTYPITVRAYYDTDTLSDSKTIDLVVENCAVEEEEEEEEEVVVVTPPPAQEEETPDIITEPVTETAETSLFSSSTYMLFLIGAIAVAIIVVIVMVVVLVSMKKKV